MGSAVVQVVISWPLLWRHWFNSMQFHVSFRLGKWCCNRFFFHYYSVPISSSITTPFLFVCQWRCIIIAVDRSLNDAHKYTQTWNKYLDNTSLELLINTVRPHLKWTYLITCISEKHSRCLLVKGKELYEYKAKFIQESVRLGSVIHY
jgi:hypothetical protein